MIALVYLLWGPLGVGPLREFLQSYREHDPGAEHQLVVLLNGLGGEQGAGTLTRPQAEAELDGTGWRGVPIERPLLDLAAYGHAAGVLEHERLCLLNSYSRPLAAGWLGALDAALDRPGVELAGATGSWESQAEWVRGRSRYWPYQLAGLAGARRDYPRFPNPHIRSTAFAANREQLLGMGLELAHDKRATYLLESGHRSITRRVLEGGGKAVVVGRDGKLYEPAEWPRSATYRSGAQRNLLVADRRTEDWELAAPRLRRRLSRDAWGE